MVGSFWDSLLKLVILLMYLWKAKRCCPLTWAIVYYAGLFLMYIMYLSKNKSFKI